NMQLSRAYLEKIASHWSRANLTSAKEAMDFAKVQNQPLQDRKRVTKNSKEVIPDWLKDRDKKSPASPPVNDKQKVNEIDRAAMSERCKKTLEEKCELMKPIQTSLNKWMNENEDFKSRHLNLKEKVIGHPEIEQF